MASETGTGDADDKGARRRVRDGIRDGVGVLSAFKDALEETIQEARERGDLSADRAKEVMKSALDRAQAAASGAREKLDFAHQAELETLQEAVEGLRARVAALEEQVFGPSEAPQTEVSTEEDAG